MIVEIFGWLLVVVEHRTEVVGVVVVVVDDRGIALKVNVERRQEQEEEKQIT